MSAGRQSPLGQLGARARPAAPVRGLAPAELEALEEWVIGELQEILGAAKEERHLCLGAIAALARIKGFM